DLIMMGRETTDFNTGVVHGMVGELLGIASFSPVMKLDIEGNQAKIAVEIDGGKELISATLPLVLGCQEPIAEWKIAGMRGIMAAKTKPIVVVAATSSVHSKINAYESPAPKGACKMIPADQAEQLVHLLKTEAKVI
ncbi:MAG: electron transfer flavoprotein subunit beta/FixA family protein, partial [Leadbetterella sp.]